MGLEALLLQQINAKLASKAIAASEAARERRDMPDSTRRAFQSRMSGDAATARAAAQNMQDAQAMVNTAQTFATTIREHMKGIQEILQDCALRDNMTGEDITAANNSVREHTDEIVRLARNAEFNGIRLMDGSSSVVQLMAGNSPRDQKLANLLDGSGTLFGAGSMDLTALQGALTFSDQAGASSALGVIDTAIERMRGVESQYAYDYKSLGNLSLMFEEQADIFEAALERDRKAASGSARSEAAYLQELLAAFSDGSVLSGTA